MCWPLLLCDSELYARSFVANAPEGLLAPVDGECLVESYDAVFHRYDPTGGEVGGDDVVGGNDDVVVTVGHLEGEVGVVGDLHASALLVEKLHLQGGTYQLLHPLGRAE